MSAFDSFVEEKKKKEKLAPSAFDSFLKSKPVEKPKANLTDLGNKLEGRGADILKGVKELIKPSLFDFTGPLGVAKKASAIAAPAIKGINDIVGYGLEKTGETSVGKFAKDNFFNPYINPIGAGAKALLQKTPESVKQGLSTGVKNIGEGYSKFKQEFPEMAKTGEDMATVASILPVEKGLQAAKLGAESLVEGATESKLGKFATNRYNKYLNKDKYYTDIAKDTEIVNQKTKEKLNQTFKGLHSKATTLPQQEMKEKILTNGIREVLQDEPTLVGGKGVQARFQQTNKTKTKLLDEIKKNAGDIDASGLESSIDDQLTRLKSYEQEIVDGKGSAQELAAVRKVMNDLTNPESELSAVSNNLKHSDIESKLAEANRNLNDKNFKGEVSDEVIKTRLYRDILDDNYMEVLGEGGADLRKRLGSVIELEKQLSKATAKELGRTSGGLLGAYSHMLPADIIRQALTGQWGAAATNLGKAWIIKKELAKGELNTLIEELFSLQRPLKNAPKDLGVSKTLKVTPKEAPLNKPEMAQTRITPEVFADKARKLGYKETTESLNNIENTRKIPGKARVEENKKRIQNGEKLAPIVVSKNNKIVDGNHRYQAYKELGIKNINILKK